MPADVINMEERKLLYYIGLGYVPKERFGYMILRFRFKDVKTLEDVVLSVCQNLKPSKVHTLGENYYDSIEAMISHHDILWCTKKDKIKSIDTPLEEVKIEYERLKSSGIDDSEINNYMLNEYSKHSKRL